MEIYTRNYDRFHIRLLMKVGKNMAVPIKQKIPQPIIIDSNDEINNIGFDIDNIVVKSRSADNKQKQPSKKPGLPAALKFNTSIGNDPPATKINRPPTITSKKSSVTVPPPVNAAEIITSTTTTQQNASSRIANMNSALNKLMPDTSQADYYEKKLDDKFADTNQLLSQTINQSDYLFIKVEEELDKYKKNPSFGGKSRSLSMSTLLNTQANILGTKISAIKESNNIRKTIVDNILKRDQMQMQARMKVFAPKEDIDQNSDKAIADAYYSLINASRYGLPTIHNPLAQSSINTGISLQGNIIPTSSLNTSIITSGPGEMQPSDPLNSFIGNNMTPNQKRMILEHNPNVKIVVFYDQSTGGKKFEALDVNTGKIIPGVQLPASFLLEDMRIDFNNALAYNSSANLNYPLVVVGRRAIDEL